MAWLWRNKDDQPKQPEKKKYTRTEVVKIKLKDGSIVEEERTITFEGTPRDARKLEWDKLEKEPVHTGGQPQPPQQRKEEVMEIEPSGESSGRPSGDYRGAKDDVKTAHVSGAETTGTRPARTGYQEDEQKGPTESRAEHGVPTAEQAKPTAEPVRPTPEPAKPIPETAESRAEPDISRRDKETMERDSKETTASQTDPKPEAATKAGGAEKRVDEEQAHKAAVKEKADHPQAKH